MFGLRASQEHHDGALPLKILEPLPSLVWRLSILFSKGGDVCPQHYSLTRWKVFAEEGFEKNFPSNK